MTLVKMADNALDTSTDALLSRISVLEAQLAGVSVVATPKVEMPEPKKTSNEEKRENQKSSEPQVKESHKAPTENKEKLIRGWSEICDKCASSDPSLLPLIKMARGYVKDDGKVTVKFQNDFAKDMFMMSGVASSLIAKDAL